MGSIVWSRYAKKCRSGVFTVTVENTKYVERGNTARLQARFEHVKEGLIDPSSPALKIYDGRNVLKATVTPTKDSTGEYYADYTFDASTYDVGPYVAEWSGTYGGKTVLARATVNVKRTVE